MPICGDHPKMHEPIRTEKTTGLENRLVRIEFDRVTGGLAGLRNLATGDEYLKESGGDGNPFRGYVDTTMMPPAATVPFPFHVQPVEDALGGKLIDPRNCRLVSSSFRKTKGGRRLILVLRHTKPDLEFTLSVTLPENDLTIDCDLTVRNAGKTAHTLMTAFPYLTGLALGENRETNLGVICRTIGSAGAEAWVDCGGVYGNNVSMQWDSVYEPRMDEGFGYVVMDPDVRNKIIRRFPGGGMSTLYFTPEKLAPGAELRYPAARLVVHNGNWRVVAKRYGEWFNHAFNPRPAPKWLDEIDAYQGPTIPPPSAGFPSFRHLDRLYLDNYFDVLEWAGYWPRSGGAHGTYHLRHDLGGAPEFRKGVGKVHEQGRRVLFYVATISVRNDSDLFKGTNLDDWKLLDRPDHMLDIDYPDGVSMCLGYEKWQDHVAETCKRLLWESGADGIRLDEFGTPFIPCFNPAHNHESPFDCSKWAMQFLAKVRAAMDEVNPDALLWSENPVDYGFKHMSSALVMYCNNDDLEPIRLAVPSARMLSYVHPGSVEAAMNGYASGKIKACRTGTYFLHRSLMRKRPADFPEIGGPAVRWHELRASFRDAFNSGEPHDRDPIAPDDPKWTGRLWMHGKYWLVVGGHLDATPLDGPTLVELPELPKNITYACEIDGRDLTRRTVPIKRKDGKVCVTVKSSSSAVFLPKPNCPPLVDVTATKGMLKAGESLIQGKEEPRGLKRGGRTKLSLKHFAPWRKSTGGKVNVKACGLDQDAENVSLPANVTVTVPADAEPGNYMVRVTGGCLEAKRWLLVDK